MALRDLNIEEGYSSDEDDLVKDFYIPTLQNSILYQRRTGYFNSRALAMASRGLSKFFQNEGKMQLICSVNLDRDDKDVFDEVEDYQDVIEERFSEVLEMLKSPYDELERDRLKLLAILLKTGRLEIKIAVKPNGGIYHEKAGVMMDEYGDAISFNGSANETPGGWLNNTESFEVSCSWGDESDRKRVERQIRIGNDIWNGKYPGIKTLDLPEAISQEVIRYASEGDDDDWLKHFKEQSDPTSPKHGHPKDDSMLCTHELLFLNNASNLWNKEDFAFAEVGVVPFPHQDYVASSVLNKWPPKCMLCDEVGLGKTIEAGLILKGFLSSGRAKKVLILVPANIMRQWQIQMLNKFNIFTWRLDGDYVVGPQTNPNIEPDKKPINRENPFLTEDIMIVSSHLIRRKERLELAQEVDYDLIFLDEAHHARARKKGDDRQQQKLMQAMEELKLRTQGLILMTATPIQISRSELWDLLMLLEMPGLWQNEDSFNRFFDELNRKSPDWGFLLKMVNSVKLTREDEDQLLEDVKKKHQDVDVYHLLSLIENEAVYDVNNLDNNSKEALKIILYRMTPAYKMIFRNTRQLLKEYRRLGLLSEKIADRKPQEPDIITMDGSSDIPGTEIALYEKIDDYVKEYYKKYETVNKGLGFLMEVYRKRLTSSFEAIRRSLKRRHEYLELALKQKTLEPLTKEVDLDEEDLEALDNLLDVKFNTLKPTLESERDYLRSFINELTDLRVDSKTEYLLDLLKDKRNKGVQQIIIFSQYADTVDYLLEYLRPRYGDLLGSYTGSGGLYYEDGVRKYCSKQMIQSKFRDPEDKLSILICTDAASEGLDLQSCNTLINYDIPWNPMRIEQRIGRIDRIGQESELIYIHSLFYKDSVEEKVYTRCLDRIDIFRDTLGNLQPILATVERGIKSGAMLDDKIDIDSIIKNVEKELDKSVAEKDENIRIENFVNSYKPSLQIEKKQVPVNQESLEKILRPLLKSDGWEENEGFWHLGEKTITFQPKLIDAKDQSAELLTPLSDLSFILKNVCSEDEAIKTEYGILHKMDVNGHSAFILEHDNSWSIVRTLDDISNPTSNYDSCDNALSVIKSEITQREISTIRSEIDTWKNRLEGWRFRVGMFLDEMYKISVKNHSGNLLDFDEDGRKEAWLSYISTRDRKPIKDLVQLIQYEPDYFESVRGRIPKQLRWRERVSTLLFEYDNINKKLATLNRSLIQIQ